MKSQSINFFLAILIATTSCNHVVETNESPLAVVIKLQSSESFANFDEGIKYLNIKEAYPTKVSDTITSEEQWKSSVMFSYNLAKDKRFTNFFKYYEYNIHENIADDTAKVYFTPFDTRNPFKSILYTLKRINGKWIVYNVYYKM